MKFLITLLLCFSLLTSLKAQVSPLFMEPTKEQADGLRAQLQKKETNDTLRMLANRELALFYLDLNSDSALYYIQQELPLTRKLNLLLWEADALDLYAIISRNKGNYVEAVKLFNQSLAITENKKAEENIWRISKFTHSRSPSLARLSMRTTVLSDMISTYTLTLNFEKELSTALHCIEVASSINDYTVLGLVHNNLGNIYIRNNKPDSALIILKKAILYSEKSGYRKYLTEIHQKIGDIYLEQNEFAKAKENFLKALVKRY